MAKFTYDFDFYTTDESFDYGDGYGFTATYQEEVTHGITVVVDSDNKILGWSGYGHFAYEVDNIKALRNLKNFIAEHIKDLDGLEDLTVSYTKEDELAELISLVDENINQAA